MELPDQQVLLDQQDQQVLLDQQDLAEHQD
jgi:hypothetical protein